MAEPFANTGFDPLFGDPLQRLIAKAAEQGIPAHIISGVRTDEDQRQLVANAAATRAGQPLPYPKRGPVPAAAPVGQSAHEYGLAGDVQADNPADQPKLIALGMSLGLSHPMSYDPTHFEAPNWRSAAATQAPPTPWSQVADVPSSYAENVDSSAAPATAAINAAAPPGMSLNSVPDRLASMVGTLESGGGRYSSAQPASMVDPFYGQYPGFAKSYGRGAAGVDNYAQAVLAANPKASVGDFYAGYFSGTGKPGSSNFNNFDRLSKGAIQDTPGSPAAQQAAAANFVKNAGVDPSAPLASVVGAPAAPQPPVEGATGAIDPSIMAHQSTTPAYTAPPSIASQVAGPLQALTKDLEDSGKGQPQGGAPDQGAQLQAQQAAAMAGAGRQQELRARAEQMLAAILAQGQRPLSWNSAPPGSGAGLQIMAPTPTPGGGYVGGTTLNSMGDSYG